MPCACMCAHACVSGGCFFHVASLQMCRLVCSCVHIIPHVPKIRLHACALRDSSIFPVLLGFSPSLQRVIKKKKQQTKHKTKGTQRHKVYIASYCAPPHKRAVLRQKHVWRRCQVLLFKDELCNGTSCFGPKQHTPSILSLKAIQMSIRSISWILLLTLLVIYHTKCSSDTELAILLGTPTMQVHLADVTYKTENQMLWGHPVALHQFLLKLPLPGLLFQLWSNLNPAVTDVSTPTPLCLIHAHF